MNYRGPIQVTANGTDGEDGADQGTPVDSKHIVHVSLTQGMDHAWPFGVSILEPIFKVFKQKELHRNHEENHQDNIICID